jgi:hypothetical protein
MAVDPKAPLRKHHYYINNHKMDRMSTLQNFWEMVQKCEFQLNYKWDNTYVQWN